MSKHNEEIVSEMSCVSEQGQTGILWTVFEGDPFCSRRIASFAGADDARDYLNQAKLIESLKSRLYRIAIFAADSPLSELSKGEVK